MTNSNDEIIQVANLMLRLYHEESDDAVKQLGVELDRVMAQMDNADISLAHFAMKMLDGGKPFQFIGDNPDKISRMRELAAHVGATVSGYEEGALWGAQVCQVVYTPPSRQ
jgi:hypothetical protein